jgi:hypothetical protein
MNESGIVLRCRSRLEAAKLMYENMRLDFQDGTKFRYFLDAFLALARSVPHILKSEFHDDNQLARWYDHRVRELCSLKIVRFLIEMRNISLKEHTPMMATTAAVSFSLHTIIGEALNIKKTSPDGETENITTASSEIAGDQAERLQPPQTVPRIVEYSFDELPKEFDENPNVMYFCKKYLDELEKFVLEAEHISEKEGVKP